mgnify:CR=1 FL=1
MGIKVAKFGGTSLADAAQFAAHLEQYAATFRARDPKRNKTLHLPSGQVKSSEAQPKAAVLQPETLVAWALAGRGFAAAWENLLDIAVGSQSYSIQGLSGTREKQTLIGLGKNGTVVMLPDAGIPNAGSWTNLIDIAAGRDFVVGLRTDGTAVAAGERAG